MENIKLIGQKRFMLLALAVVINLLLAAVYIMWQAPMRDDVAQRSNTLDAEINGLTSSIQNVKQDLADFNANLPKYQDMHAKGFFSAQNRFDIGRSLDAVRKKTDISGFSYDIGDVETLEVPVLTAQNYSLLRSKMKITAFSTISDQAIYSFADLMQTSFPMFLRFSSLSVKKTKELDEETLKQIAAGQPVQVVDATAEFEWYTLRYNPPAANPAGGQQ